MLLVIVFGLPVHILLSNINAGSSLEPKTRIVSYSCLASLAQCLELAEAEDILDFTFY